MSLRKVLGADADRVHEQVDTLLDREDAMIVLLDGSRAINYAHGFGVSPSQLELLALEIERAVRRVTGSPIQNRKVPRNSRVKGADGQNVHNDMRVRCHLNRVPKGPAGAEVDRRGGSARSDETTGSAARVLRLARDATGTKDG